LNRQKQPLRAINSNNEYPTCQMWPQKSSGVHGACFESREFLHLLILLLQDVECHAFAIAGQYTYSMLFSSNGFLVSSLFVAVWYRRDDTYYTTALILVPLLPPAVGKY
jgi:hypothetical protein